MRKWEFFEVGIGKAEVGIKKHRAERMGQREEN